MGRDNPEETIVIHQTLAAKARTAQDQAALRAKRSRFWQLSEASVDYTHPTHCVHHQLLAAEAAARARDALFALLASATE
jgi:hypothetical protein